MTENTLYSRGNPYSVVAPTGTYTATHGEFVISDGSDITLPAAEPDSVVVVRASPGTETTVLPPGTTTLQLQEKGVALGAGECGVFISDGLDWYVENTVDFTGRDIPDSAVLHWPMREGSGSTVSEVLNEISGQDGTINGNVNWTSDSWFDGFSLDSDGTTGDYVETGQWANWEDNVGGTWAILFTLQTTDSGGTNCILGINNDAGGTFFQLTMGAILGSGASGQPTISIRDGSNDLEVSTDQDLSDGDAYRVVVQQTGDGGADSIKWYVDGSETGTVEHKDASVNYPGFDKNVRFHARNRSGGNSDNYLDGILDNIIVTNDSLSSQEISDDYNNQPWSS